MAKLYFYYSAMNAGKSTNLLQSAYNYQERGMRTLLFAPQVDDRYGIGKITSRIGLQADATTFDPAYDLYLHVRTEHQRDSVHCVLVDEAQFLTAAQVLQLTLVVDELNIPVLTYGLRTDFRGEPFEGSRYLLAWAEELQEIKTVCRTGQKATMNARLDAEGRRVWSGAQVEIGHHYEAMSRRAFELARVSPIEYRPPPEDETQVALGPTVRPAYRSPVEVKLYVARHEEAEPGHSMPDRQRSLTGFGRRRARATGRLLVERPEVIDTVWTSPLVRAVQTAEIFADALGIDERVSALETIAEPPTIDTLVDLVVASEASIQGLLMVGHQPTLGIFVGQLLGREYPRSLRPGTVVALSVDRDRRSAEFRWAVEGHQPTVVERLDP